MGSGGMIVMDEDTCMVDVARYFLSFLKEESCGKDLAPEPHVNLVSGKLGKLGELPLVCNECKRKRESMALAENAHFS